MAKRRLRPSNPSFGVGADESQPILKAFRATADRLGLQIKSRRGMRIKVVDSSGEHFLNISNLAKQLRQYEPEGWNQLIEAFLSNVATAHVGGTIELFQQPFAKIKDMLMPCLKVEAPDERLWSRELAPDLTVLIALDTPEHMLFVREQEIDESDHSADEWLEQAKRNLTARTPDEWYQAVFKRPYELRLTTTEDCYDSARSLVLDRLLPKEARHGWIVAPLSRDEMAFVPNRYRRREQVIADLAVKAAGRINDLPYPISRRVYTVKDGEWTTQPMILGPNNTPIFIQVIGPEFQEAAE